MSPPADIRARTGRHRKGDGWQDYKGEIFFDDYAAAQRIARDAGILQPGARQPAPPNLAGLPLPDTNVAAITEAERKEKLFEKLKDYWKENVASLFKRAPKPAPAPAPPTSGLSRGVGGP